MRLNAYLLLGDPAFLAASVGSYYDLVDRIVICYDEDNLSWAGDPLPIRECLAELADADPDGKFDYRPGQFADREAVPLDLETRQRRVALVAAATDADWVLQLDTDEVIPDPAIFVEMIGRANRSESVGLDYPSRWLYARLADGTYLESSSRFWGPVASYPGPLAVRRSASLWDARRCEGDLFRVDFRSTNTDPWRYGHGLPVHAVVPVDAGVLHFSWVRKEDELLRKSAVNSHSDLDWRLDEWQRNTRHPWRAVLATPVRTRGELHPRWLRRSRLPLDPPARIASR